MSKVIHVDPQSTIFVAKEQMVDIRLMLSEEFGRLSDALVALDELGEGQSKTYCLISEIYNFIGDTLSVVGNAYIMLVGCEACCEGMSIVINGSKQENPVDEC